MERWGWAAEERTPSAKGSLSEIQDTEGTRYLLSVTTVKDEGQLEHTVF